MPAQAGKHRRFVRGDRVWGAEGVFYDNAPATGIVLAPVDQANAVSVLTDDGHTRQVEMNQIELERV